MNTFEQPSEGPKSFATIVKTPTKRKSEVSQGDIAAEDSSPPTVTPKRVDVKTSSLANSFLFDNLSINTQVKLAQPSCSGLRFGVCVAKELSKAWAYFCENRSKVIDNKFVSAATEKEVLSSIGGLPSWVKAYYKVTRSADKSKYMLRLPCKVDGHLLQNPETFGSALTKMCGQACVCKCLVASASLH